MLRVAGILMLMSCLQPVKGQLGDTRDILAATVGWSGMTLARARAVVTAAEELACPLALLPGLLAPALVPAQVGGAVPICARTKTPPQ